MVGSWPVVVLDGEIDLATASDYAPALAEALQGSPAGIVLDLTTVTFMDVAGLRLILGVLRTETPVRLVGVHRVVRRVLDVSGVAEHPLLTIG